MKIDAEEMDTYTAEEAKERLQELLHRAIMEHRHCRIDSAAGAVVMIPEETYQNIAVTLELLTTPGFLEQLGDMDADEIGFDDIDLSQEAVS